MEPAETARVPDASGQPRRMPSGPVNWRNTFRALRHRNFRLFLGGQIVSLAGTWMQQVALSWLVYRLTRSPMLLGLVGFAGQIPSLLLAPVAGVWADRGNRRRIVIATQALAMVQALLLAALVLRGTVSIGHVMALSVFLGLVNGVDVPTRQAFLVEMVTGREDLANAIALNSSVFNAARLVGPAVAGVMIALVGEGTVFLLNGLSYVAVIAALYAMKIAPRPRAPGHDEPLRRKLAEAELTFPVAVDNKTTMWQHYFNSYWPSVYLIDRSGVARWGWAGELGWKGASGEKQMRGKIQEMLRR